MSTDYTGINFEETARELLAPLSRACPCSVWEEISTELETKREKTAKKWLNSSNTPVRTVSVAAGSLMLLVLCGWLFLNGKSSKSNVLMVKHVGTQPFSAPVKNSYPANKPDNEPSVNTLQATPATVAKKDVPKTVENINTETVVTSKKPQPLAITTDNTSLLQRKDVKKHKSATSGQSEENSNTSPEHLTSNQNSEGVEVNLGNNDNSSTHMGNLVPASDDSIASVQDDGAL